MSTDITCDSVVDDFTTGLVEMFDESQVKQQQAWDALSDEEQDAIHQELLDLNAQGRLGDHWAYRFVFQH